MTPDDVDKLDRKVDGLMASYGELREAQGRHDERIDGAADDVAALRGDVKELERELLDAISRSEGRQRELVQTVKASCDQGWSDMRKWVEAFELERKAERVREADRAERSKTSGRMLAVGVVAAVISAIGVVVALGAVVLGG